ncbi:MAG: hypothetical protein JST70_15125 [Bacteroidetes bacterium]|nr:hypothetical protein [Bacteroidota bacterium]
MDLESLDFKHDIPVELLRKKLKIYYKKGSSLFIDDPRFLFYIGWMISISEWVFDVDDRKHGHGLIQRAHALDPANQLYLWGLRGALTQTNRYDFPELNIIFKTPDSEFEGLGYTLKDYFNEMIDATNKRTSSDLGLDI